MAKKTFTLAEGIEMSKRRAAMNQANQRTARTGTTPAATTLTPESSEQPRETRDGTPLTEEQLMLQDAMATGTGFMADGKRVRPEDLQFEPKTSKVSSPELASLAAKYLDFTINDPAFAQTQADVRALAASVLAQAEPKTNAGE